MQRAIALYNSYGFGYMLGMNFRNRAGKREMLWPQDLDEILELAGERGIGGELRTTPSHSRVDLLVLVPEALGRADRVRGRPAGDVRARPCGGRA